MQSLKSDNKYKSFVAELKLFEDYLNEVDKNAKAALRKRFINVKKSMKDFNKYIYTKYFKEVCDNNDFIFSNQVPTKYEYFKLKATTKGLEYHHIIGPYNKLLFIIRFVNRNNVNYMIINISNPRHLNIETREMLDKIFGDKYDYLKTIEVKLVDDEVRLFNLSDFFGVFNKTDKISTYKLPQFENDKIRFEVVQKVNNLITYTSNNSIKQSLQLLGYKNV